jgi:excisionase family DNA binding protein
MSDYINQLYHTLAFKGYSMNEILDQRRRFMAPMTREELANELKVSVMTITREIESGRLNYARVGKGNIRFFENHLAEYFAKCEADTYKSERDSESKNANDGE